MNCPPNSSRWARHYGDYGSSLLRGLLQGESLQNQEGRCGQKQSQWVVSGALIREFPPTPQNLGYNSLNFEKSTEVGGIWEKKRYTPSIVGYGFYSSGE